MRLVVSVLFCLSLWGCSGETNTVAEPAPGDASPGDAGIDSFGVDSPVPACTEEGQRQSCYTGPATSLNLGICRTGIQRCVGGSWGPCEDQVLPQEEICDLLDNDCDGVADESCACAIGATESCYAGPSGTQGVGVCLPGERTCADGQWPATCDGDVVPGEEECNGDDDNCDGVTDEGCPTCSDGTKNQGEFEVDCGGPCPRCEWSGNNCAACPWGYSQQGDCLNALTCDLLPGTTGRFFRNNQWQDEGNGCACCNIMGGIDWEIWTE